MTQISKTAINFEMIFRILCMKCSFCILLWENLIEIYFRKRNFKMFFFCVFVHFLCLKRTCVVVFYGYVDISTTVISVWAANYTKYLKFTIQLLHITYHDDLMIEWIACIEQQMKQKENASLEPKTKTTTMCSRIKEPLLVQNQPETNRTHAIVM